LKYKDYQVAKKINLVFLSVFYIIAGLNHFRDPTVYKALIPPYFHYHDELNIISGALEIAGGILMFFPGSRKAAAYLISSLLLAFIPAHIYLIRMSGCVSENLCVAAWVAWVRLIPFQFILIWWVWKTYRWSKPVNKAINYQ
jgi:uncharacterized membrane protein